MNGGFLPSHRVMCVKLTCEKKKDKERKTKDPETWIWVWGHAHDNVGHQGHPHALTRGPGQQN